MTGWRLAAVAAIAALWAASPAAAAAPSNDDFENAAPLTTGEPAAGTTEEALPQEGEPVHSTYVAPNRTVWFTWTAPQTGLAKISACGTSFDSVVAVYGGATLDQTLYSTRIANDDDGCGAGYASLVFLRVEANKTYRIVLDGRSWSDAGAYQLVADMAGTAAQPANDDIDAATSVQGPEVAVTGTNAGATSGWNEWPLGATQLVWWRWVSPVNGQVRVDTCASGFDTYLGVRRRDGDYWLGVDFAREGCGDRGMVTLNAVAGEEYWIGVGGEAGTTGTIDLRVDATPDTTPPTTTITSGPRATWGRRVAHVEWTVADEADTTSECSLDDGAWFECVSAEELSGLGEGEHVFRVRSVDQYGNAESPGAEKRFTVAIPEAPNDDFADAAPLVPGVPVSVNNGKATAEPGEPSHDSWYFAQGLSANWSVWFKFTPAYDGTAQLDWCASEVDVTMAVYTGSAVDALTRVAQRDEGCGEELYVQGGVTYRIAIDGFARNLDYGTGPITLTVGYNGAPDAEPSPTGGSSAAASSSTSPNVAPAPPAAGGVPGRAALQLADSRPRTAQVDRRGRFRVRGAWVRCHNTRPCLVRAKVLSRRGSRTLGAGTLRVTPGGRQAVRARLSRSARSLLARRGRLRVRVRVTLSPGLTRTTSLTLLAPRRRAR